MVPPYRFDYLSVLTRQQRSAIGFVLETFQSDSQLSLLV